MKRAGLINKCKLIFHKIHHYLLKLPVGTKLTVVGALVFLDIIAFGYSSILKSIKIGGVDSAYETLQAFPVLSMTIKNVRWLFLFFTILILLAMFIKRKMVIITIRSIEPDLEKANTEEYNTKYSVVHKDIDLYELNKGKAGSDLIKDAVKIIENTYESVLSQKRYMKTGIYGNAPSPLLFKMGTLLKNTTDVKIFHKFLNANVYTEWSQSSNNYEIRISNEEHPRDGSSELIIYISTTRKPALNHLIDLKYTQKHVLVFTGERVGIDVVTSYTDATKIVQTINSSINDYVEKYGITKVHLIITSSSDFTLYLGMKLQIKSGVSCYVYQTDPAPNHQWYLDINRSAENSFFYNNNRRDQNQELLIEPEGAFYEHVSNLKNNAYLATRDETDDPKKFPFAKKVAEINRITFLNMAASTFISNAGIANAYKKEGAYARWFFERLDKGDLETTVIILNPHSDAAKDAALSKMNPHGLVQEKDSIIQHNINTLIEYKKEKPGANINLYLTDISLPYGIMLAENTADNSMSYMKIDLYSPMGQQSDYRGFDNERPSFYLLRNNPNTAKVYDKFIDVIERVKNDSVRTKRYEGKKLEWLLNKPIIHRGRFSNNLPEHSVRGYFSCIINNYPMEVDVLILKDQSLLIGRDEEVIHKVTKKHYKLSDLTLKQIRSMKTEEYCTSENNSLNYKFEEMMTLPELLCLVDGKVGLVIELKIDSKADEEICKRVAKRIINTLQYYNGDYCIHAANPKILYAIRKLDQTVILGQISWSFDGVDVPEEYKECHVKMNFMNSITPDFISYKITEILGNEELLGLCQTHNLPLITWTVLKKEDEELFHQIIVKRKNLIIEGAPTFFR